MAIADSDGRHVKLNLGPLTARDGASVGLNLGVEWDDDIPVPVVRGVRVSSRLAWRVADRRVKGISTGWGASALLLANAYVSWKPSLATRSSADLAWGFSPTAVQSCAMGWRSAAQRERQGWDFGWSELGREHASAVLNWGSKLASMGALVGFGWRGLGLVENARTLCWQGRIRTAQRSHSWMWGHPQATTRQSLLRWGPAKGIPWGVRPTPGPGPDPDPERFPPGNKVGLNLGCLVVGDFGFAPLNLGISACYMVRPQRRTYVVINTVSLVRLPDRTPIEVTRISLGASRGTWGWTFDIELADPQQLALLKPSAAGPRLFEVALNGYVWTGIIESFQKQREFSGGGVRLSGRSRTALLAAPYAPARVKATTEDRSMAQLVAEELADTGFTSEYDTVDWNVPAGAWFYDASTPLDAISALAEASGGVVQSDPAAPAMRVRAAYPVSPWDWRTTPPDHVLQEDVVLTESLQMRSAPLYDAVVVTGELAGKGVTCKVRRSGEEGRLYAQQVSSPLITVPAAGAERGRNILCDRGERAAVDLTVPLFAQPLKPGEVGLVLPLDLVEVVGADGTWHGQCESLRIEVSADDQAVVIEQTATLERHYTDAD